ncbi:type I restriction endonuclease subunit R [Coleofasciculus sp.]|uniref:type I restriction endonuclease subunit R n=1 Tax=Coleofasciculus sp. TaxID=3100458 RepID=UPI003A34E656
MAVAICQLLFVAIMVQTIAISEKTTLKYLRDNFNLERATESSFFPEWQGELPALSDTEIQALTRIRNRYFHQLDEGMMLENGVKMMIVSPLLELAGFYDPPFRARFEPPVNVAVDTGEEVLNGRIDALIVQNQIWVWVLEAKRTTFSLSLGIPQALTYMLANPERTSPTYGLLCSGESFIVLKLQSQPTAVYGLSNHFNILNDGDLGRVLQILRKIGQAALPST